MRTIAEWLAEAATVLKVSSETPYLDAQVLLVHVLEKPRSWLLAHTEIELTIEQENNLRSSLKRVLNGEALPYVLGHWEFFGLDFTVNPAVLIPRPETELLVEQALEWLGRHPRSRRAVDVGTGSGCIAISLAVKIPDLEVIATDISNEALRVASQNAIKHGVERRVSLIRADLIDPISVDLGKLTPRPINLIAANLPYIPRETLHTLEVYGKEPSLALDGGPDGLEQVRRLLNQAPTYLAPGGLVLLEIEHRQGDAVRRLAQTAFPQAQVRILQDLAGLDRLVKIDNLMS